MYTQWNTIRFMFFCYPARYNCQLQLRLWRLTLMVTRNPTHYPRVAIVNVLPESTNVSPPCVLLSQASPFSVSQRQSFSVSAWFFGGSHWAIFEGSCLDTGRMPHPVGGDMGVTLCHYRERGYTRFETIHKTTAFAGLLYFDLDCLLSKAPSQLFYSSS